MIKYVLLQTVRLCAALSFMVAAFIIADDFDLTAITDEQCVGHTTPFDLPSPAFEVAATHVTSTDQCGLL